MLQSTGFLELFGGCRQVYSPQKRTGQSVYLANVGIEGHETHDRERQKLGEER
jgi:hypothetical protein